MKRTYIDLVRHVCKYAEMYVGERRFRTVAAYLNGYQYGRTDNDNRAKDSLGIVGFPEWLAEKAHSTNGIETNLTWDGHIARMYPTDDEALAQLPMLIDEFIAEKAVLKDP
jgi:hypothetical protein